MNESDQRFWAERHGGKDMAQYLRGMEDFASALARVVEHCESHHADVPLELRDAMEQFAGAIEHMTATEREVVLDAVSDLTSLTKDEREKILGAVHDLSGAPALDEALDALHGAMSVRGECPKYAELLAAHSILAELTEVLWEGDDPTEALRAAIVEFEQAKTKKK